MYAVTFIVALSQMTFIRNLQLDCILPYTFLKLQGKVRKPPSLFLIPASKEIPNFAIYIATAIKADSKESNIYFSDMLRIIDC